MKNIKKEIKNLYKIKGYNVICIALICLDLLLILRDAEIFFKEILDLHIGLNIGIDFLPIYSGFLALVLPVAILIIERIEDKDNAIISETYLKQTRIFPAIVYFVSNLLIFTFYKNQYFFITTSIISFIIIIHIYYKAFKMISDLIYEKKEINKVQEEIIARDLFEQTEQYSENNLISNYKKYGIMIGKYNYVSTSEMKMHNIYPKKEYLIIEQYNYKILNRIIKELKKINNDYVASMESDDVNNEIKNEKKLNIIIMLLDIGASTDKNKSWITIYYNEKYKDNAKTIIKLLNDKVYTTSENNNHLYIETAYEKIQKECVESLNSMSSTLLTYSLDKYLEIYKNYVNEISEKIGMYSYETSYKQVNSIYRINVYDFFRNIQKSIYDYGEIITGLNNSKLMNSLVSFLYNMILYSYRKRELLSIQHLYNTYRYLNECSLELNETASFEKILLEVFEFMSILRYDYNNVEKNFIHDTFLICNKTIGNIIYDLSKNDKEKLFRYYGKTMKFIENIKSDIEQFDISNSEKNSDYYNTLDDIYKNYICNLFVTTAYIINNMKQNDEEITKILSYYKKIDCNELSDILTNCIKMDYKGLYSWDLMEPDKETDSDGVYSIHTTSYLIHFYCLIITNLKIKMTNLKSSYELSVYVDNITSELKKLDKSEYIAVFEDIVEKVKEEEKEYLRNTAISNSKIEQFKNKFKENYYKYNRLYRLFEETNNLKRVKRKKKGQNYLAMRNILDKTYFLEHTPNNRCIIWTNFEDGYANSFINSEERKFSLLLNEKATYVDENILTYLDKLTKSQLKKSIIFSNYETIYNIVGYEKIKYSTENENKNNYANMYIFIKKEYIPIIIIDGLDSNYIYHVYNNKLGKLEKTTDEFKIEVTDFYNNEKALNKIMKEKINGLELEDEQRRNNLLESVDLLIQEYVLYDVSGLCALKFNH